jgi:uncharacterized protein (TIGR00369 family)
MNLKGDIQKTHLAIFADLVGTVEHIETGKSARVTLEVNNKMKADEQGLIHGGFTFGLADYAAMVAINDPFVVLLSANVFFRRPVILGDRLTAMAIVTETEGKRKKVSCEIFNQSQVKVLEGEFHCRVLPKHILAH